VDSEQDKRTLLWMSFAWAPRHGPAYLSKEKKRTEGKKESNRKFGAANWRVLATTPGTPHLGPRQVRVAANWRAPWLSRMGPTNWRVLPAQRGSPRRGHPGYKGRPSPPGANWRVAPRRTHRAEARAIPAPLQAPGAAGSMMGRY
jgi:hypothetical protein